MKRLTRKNLEAFSAAKRASAVPAANNFSKKSAVLAANAEPTTKTYSRANIMRLAATRRNRNKNLKNKVTLLYNFLIIFI